MQKAKKYLKKEDFNDVINLYSKHSWLCDKEDSLIELIRICDNDSEKSY